MKTESNKSIRGFHFASDHFNYDLTHIKVEEGVELHFNGTPVLCNQGLHSSPTILDALKYAKGFNLSVTETSGNIQQMNNKFVGQHRKHIQVVNVKKWIILFAYWCARRAKKHAYAANAAATTYTTYAANAANDAANYAANAATYAANAANAANAATYTTNAEIKLQHKVLNAYCKKAGLKF